MGNHSPKKGVTAIFDIGASSIGAALVEATHGAPPTVVYATRALFPFLKEPEPVRLTQAMLSTFVVVALRLQREGLPRMSHALPWGKAHPNQAVCFFSSPWLSSEVSNASMQKDEAFSVRADVASMLFPRNESFPRVEYLQTEKEAFGKRAKSGSENGAPADTGGAMTIEQHVVRVELNGYPTNTPGGKMAKSLEALVVGSVVPSELYEKLHSVIDRVLHGGALYGHSFFMPLSRMADTMAGAEDSFLLIHVGGEICDVTVIRDGTPTLFVSIPFGTQPLIRAVAAKAKIIPEEVGARLALLSHAGNSEEDKKGGVIVRTLSETEQKWKDLVREALREAPFTAPLPNKAYVSCEEPYLPWFSRLFGQISLPEATFNTTPFSIVQMDKKALSGLAKFEREDEFDSALALQAAYIA